MGERQRRRLTWTERDTRRWQPSFLPLVVIFCVQLMPSSMACVAGFSGLWTATCTSKKHSGEERSLGLPELRNYRQGLSGELCENSGDTREAKFHVLLWPGDWGSSMDVKFIFTDVHVDKLGSFQSREENLPHGSNYCIRLLNEW